MRRAAKTDANQAAIVAGLRAVGASVQILAAVGHGCPDLLIGYRSVNYVLEIKDGRKPASETKLTPDQVRWHADWRGQSGIAYSLDDALALIGATTKTGRG